MFVGQTINQFLIEKELGSGAMGSVYRAKYIGDDRRFLKELGSNLAVALKVIAFGLSGNEGAIARFEREVKILKQLRHPHIVQLYGTGRYRQTPFFVMEYIKGSSLDRILTTRTKIHWEDTIELSKQLCLALQHAHEKGIIHRDLKPSNLMITQENELKLTDFGIAKDVDLTALTGANNTIGTAAYMSPEQCRGEKELTSKSDLYSLGVVMYELVTGKKPFVAESAVDLFLLHVNGEFVRPSRLVPEIPIWLDTLICQLLEKQPNDRPRDAQTVHDALEKIEEKISAQQSVGADIANARAVDRVPINHQLDEKDREAGRLIQSGKRGKKRRKKNIPFYRKGWFSLVVAIVFFTGIIIGILTLFAPDRPEKMLQKIEMAKSAASKLRALENYIDHYGNREDSTTESVWVQYRREVAIILEKAMLNRYNHPAMREKAEADYVQEAYEKLMKALTEENDGNIDTARKIWMELDSDYSNNSDRKIARWGWLAHLRLESLVELTATETKLKKILIDAYVDEVEPETSNSFEHSAVTALRFEDIGDTFAAVKKWESLAKEIGNSAENRIWLLLAKIHVHSINSLKTVIAPEDRIDLLKSRINQAKEWLKDSANPVQRRQGRNLLRTISILYEHEPKELAQLSKQAATILNDPKAKEKSKSP